MEDLSSVHVVYFVVAAILLLNRFFFVLESFAQGALEALFFLFF